MGSGGVSLISLYHVVRTVYDSHSIPWSATYLSPISCSNLKYILQIFRHLESNSYPLLIRKESNKFKLFRTLQISEKIIEGTFLSLRMVNYQRGEITIRGVYIFGT